MENGTDDDLRPLIRVCPAPVQGAGGVAVSGGGACWDPPGTESAEEKKGQLAFQSWGCDARQSYPPSWPVAEAPLL